MTFNATSRPRDHAGPLRRFHVGETSVYPLVQLHYRVDPARFFPDIGSWPVDETAWYWQEPYVDDGLLVIDIGGFLIRTRTRTILVDAGVGNGKTRPNPNFDHRGDDWLADLARIGVSPDDVDTVIFTHLHVDHVGFATTWSGGRWRPTFPNATYLTTQAEFHHWTSPAASQDLARLGDYVADSVLPLADAGVLSLVRPDLRICGEVRLVPAPGHTPGNVCVEVSSAGRHAVFAGDMIHHVLQLAFPDWSTDYCIDPGRASLARRRLLSGLGSDDLLFSSHFPSSLPGRVTAQSTGGYLFSGCEGEKL